MPDQIGSQTYKMLRLGLVVVALIAALIGLVTLAIVLRWANTVEASRDTLRALQAQNELSACVREQNSAYTEANWQNISAVLDAAIVRNDEAATVTIIQEMQKTQSIQERVDANCADLIAP